VTDRENDAEVGDVDLTLSYILSEPPEGLSHLAYDTSFLWLNGKGTFNSDKGNSTTLRLGYKFERFVVREKSAFGYTLGAAPYLLTDMHFNAFGYGLNASFQPIYSPRLRQTNEGGGTKFLLGMNAQRIDKGGETGFADGDERLAVYGDVSHVFKPDVPGLKVAPDLTLRYRIEHDFLSGDTDDLIAATLGFPLHPENDVRLTLTHAVGTDFDKRKPVDSTTAKIEFRY